jgi:transposase
MIKVDEKEHIRRAHYVEHKSIRQIARELGHSRGTVRKALASAEPEKYRLKRPRLAPVLGPYKGCIDTLLAENETLPPKQRYTWHKIYETIQAAGYRGSGSNLRQYIGERRREKRRPAVYLPLEFDPGTDGQVDWGEAQVIMNGVQTTVQLFVMRLCYSRRTFAMAFPTQEQESFFEGHVQAFHHFGGVPQRLTYDNLKAAVFKILIGKNRQEQDRFVVFRSHYLFESNYCTPGAGNQKGGVEHGVGYSRRNFLVPLPRVSGFAELNAHLLQECLKDDQRQVTGQPVVIGQAWEHERAFLRPLPAQDFPCCQTLSVTLTPYSQVVVDTNRYSVPTDQAASQLVAKVYPFRVEVFRPGDKEPIACHARCYGRKQDIFDPLHYLSLLEQRPGAFHHAKPLRRWREGWPPIYEQLLQHLQAEWPDGRGIREFIRVLSLHRDYPAHLIEQAVSQSLTYHCAHADGVKLCLDQLLHPEPTFSSLDLSDRPRLVAIGSQAIDLTRYDQLLEGVPCQ